MRLLVEPVDEAGDLRWRLNPLAAHTVIEAEGDEHPIGQNIVSVLVRLLRRVRDWTPMSVTFAVLDVLPRHGDEQVFTFSVDLDWIAHLGR